MTKAFNYLILSLACLFLVACQQTNPDQEAILAKTPPTSSASSAMSQESSQEETSPASSDLTPDQVAAAEGDLGEQVVVAITADGFATSHGDHYHYYNGQLSYDALWSRDLLVDASYVFDPAHVVSDLVDGHVVQVGEDYLIYPTTDNPQNARD